MVTQVLHYSGDAIEPAARKPLFKRILDRLIEARMRQAMIEIERHRPFVGDLAARSQAARREVR